MDPTEKRSLIKKRAVIKSRVTRLSTFVDSFQAGSNLNDIRVRQSLLKTSIDEYNEVQTQLEINDVGESHDANRESFEDLCLDLESKMTTLLQASVVVPPQSASSCNSHEIRLPAISLPKFNGCVAEFMHFFDTFKALVINNEALTDVQRYYYLLSCVSGEPRKLIENLPVTESNFKVAWDLIVQRYNNPKLIVDLHTKELLHLPNVKNESARDLRMLINQLLRNLNAIEVMQIGVPLHEVVLSHILLDRVSVNLRKQWETKTADTTFPRLKDLIAFLEGSCQTLELIQSDKMPHHFQQPAAKHVNTEGYSSRRTLLATAPDCEFCNSTHKLRSCPKFKEIDIISRIDFVNRQRLCFNCLDTNHRQKECRAGNCRICNKRHHTLLHKERGSDGGDRKQETAKPQQQTYCTVKRNHQHAEVLLATALVNIAGKNGKLHQCRALLDSASQMNFMSSRLADRMGLQLSRHPIPISGISDVQTIESSHVCEVYISSRVADHRVRAVCAILPRITGSLPTVSLDTSTWHLPKHITLADPSFSQSGEIDLLLGASIFFDALKPGQLKRENYPTLQETSFGWIVSGNIPQHYMKHNARKILSCLTRNNLNMQVERFWQQEEIKPGSVRTKEERLCEEHFAKNIRRNASGRFVVRLPMKPNHAGLGDSMNNATRCLRHLERRLQRQPKLKAQYVSFMREYAEMHHMELVTTDTENCTYYMPHHAVLKESSSTTKLRVVFNASAKTTSNTSLNDIMMVGPTVQDDLYSIVLRFRMHRYAFTADIAKMYRQIEVGKADQDLQRILWRESPNEPIRAYRLTTVTYGTAAAPFLATRCLLQLAEDERKTYPRAATVLQRDFYVDDVLSGADTIEEALSLQEELIRLLNSGGFPLRKWCANDSRLLENIPPEYREAPIPWSLNNEQQETVKTLGLLWYPHSDTFRFLAMDVENGIASWTKRRVLSRIASIFDPAGLLGPVVVTCKMFLQHLWQEQVDWDKPLPEDLKLQWEQLDNHLPSLNNIYIERRVIPNGVERLELHGFSDASERAYGACLYLRSVCAKNSFSVKLLSSKSRVAPIKQISLPRLELCAALLLARLMEKVKTALHIRIAKTYFWTDSTVVLAWLAKEPTSWKTFVANRVSEIHQLSAAEDWHHVSSGDNPADIISRGITPQHLGENKLWWTGPPWLHHPSSTWPASTMTYAEESADMPENRHQRVCLIATVCIMNEIAQRYSSWSKLQRVMAYVLRYINNLRRQPTKRHSGNLTTGELHSATKATICMVQQQDYCREIEELQHGRTIPKKSKLHSLHPFLDKEQLLRVGGRLEQSKAPYSQKHPMILPSKHHITKLIVMGEHLRLLHAGPQLLLASLRQRYWIPNGRSVIRQVIHKCLPCYRLKAATATQLMGQLPSVRVEQSRPFLNCGVDYGGPLYVRNGGRRSKIRAKVYIALFVCMATKAVHIELVTDLSSQAFIAALRRFISRRGACANVYSDNGRTFVGARNELHELYKLFNSQLHATQVQYYASQNGIQWHFIPPHAPNFGGLWEAGIKSIKTHLKRVVGNQVLTFEELYTLLTQIEACLNSRPITQLSDNPDEFSYLTPGHFIIGEPLTTIPEPDLLSEPSPRLSRWQLIQQCKQHVWKRWSQDYLSQLQQRAKWSSTKDNLQPGTLVLLKEDNLPPLVWRAGVIVGTHPGPDGLVRVVSVRTATGIQKRPLSKICVVPQET